MRYIVTGRTRYITRQFEQLVEIGIARFQFADIATVAFINEPAAMYALTNLLLADGKNVAEYLRLSFDMARGTSIGNIFEEMFAYQLYQKFRGGGCSLGEVFDFQGDIPSWANETTSLASICDATAEPVDMQPTASSVFAFQADDLKWAHSPNGIPLLFPERLAGPDVIGLFQRSDRSKLLVLCQNKLVRNIVNLADALPTLDPELFFASKVAILIIYNDFRLAQYAVCNLQRRSEEPELNPSDRNNFLANLKSLGFDARSKDNTLLVLATLQGKVKWNNKYVTEGLKDYPIAFLQPSFMEGSIEFKDVLSTFKAHIA
jgi:hypothetical protein